MNLAKDGTIILDLDEAAETNYATILREHCHLPPSLIEEWVTIQFGSLEPMVFPVMVPTTLVEVELTLDTFSDDDEEWTLVTRRRPKTVSYTHLTLPTNREV